MFLSVNTRTSLTSALAALFLAALVLGPVSSAYAQDDAADSKPAPPDPEDVKKALALIGEGKTLANNGEYVTAIAKYEEAFALVPDPQIQFLIGDAYRSNGENEKAVEAWKKYVELAPEGQAVEQANERIATVEKEIEENKKAKEAEAKRLAEEEAKKKKAEEEKKRIEASKLPMAVGGMVLVGVDQATSVIIRAMAGGMLRFGRFAPEAHIGFDGFIKVADAGTKAQSFTLLDLGARYAFSDDQFVGPFMALGGSFSVFAGRPKQIVLQNDEKSCGRFEGNDCAFEVDKLITGRVGFGYGFRASEKTTVALRLDFSTFWYSVAGNQPPEAGFPAAGEIEKPQIAFAALVGLEFLRWR